MGGRRSRRVGPRRANAGPGESPRYRVFYLVSRATRRRPANRSAAPHPARRSANSHATRLASHRVPRRPSSNANGSPSVEPVEVQPLLTKKAVASIDERAKASEPFFRFFRKCRGTGQKRGNPRLGSGTMPAQSTITRGRCFVPFAFASVGTDFLPWTQVADNLSLIYRHRSAFSRWEIPL